MQAFLQDKAALLLVQFTESGEPFIPDANSVSWTLRAHDGTQVVGYIDTAISTGVSTVEVSITVPALQNTITAPRDYEKRSVIVSALRGGKPWTKVCHYRIIPWSLHTVTPEAVRSLSGLQDYDLPDAEIDIFEAYLQIRERMGAVALQTALASGVDNEILANRAIAAQALLNRIPTLQTRLLKRRSDGSLQAERFPIDLKDLEARLRGYISEAIIAGVEDNGAVPMNYSFGLPTDPVTG